LRVLCFNAGSSTTRIAGFEWHDGVLTEALARQHVSGADWQSAFATDFAPDAVAHRIVRGRKTSVEAEAYTAAVHQEIAGMQHLAPTHDPQALALLAGSQNAFPQAAQIVVYDSAFHETIAAEYQTYALPQAWRASGIRRVGFHGLSCAYAAEWLAQHAGGPAHAVHAHLGNGCSVTALRAGKSAATSMGYTPLEGMVMGTRSGSIDPAILLQLQRAGWSADELGNVLFSESGLLALCGTNDMREIEERRAGGDEKAALAFDVFVASACGAIAQMAAAAGGVDALTFGGGIGLHSQAVRDSICARLDWMLRGARVAALDVQEERMMALAAIRGLPHSSVSESKRSACAAYTPHACDSPQK
jgi:acetate kinase